MHIFITRNGEARLLHILASIGFDDLLLFDKAGYLFLKEHHLLIRHIDCLQSEKADKSSNEDNGNDVSLHAMNARFTTGWNSSFLEAKIDVLRGTIVATCVYFGNIFPTPGITSR